MAGEFKKTAIQSFPQNKDTAVTSDTLYWRRLRDPIVQKAYAAITHVEFSPVHPHNYAVTCSAKLQIYDAVTNKVARSITRFHGTAHSGSFRGDGGLLVAGGSEGMVRLFDVDGRMMLRVFKMHSGPVQVTKFTADSLHVFSGSDDKTVRLLDIPSEAEVGCYREFNDYVRCGACSRSSNDIVVAGSYDHTVRLFDTRTSASVMTVDHGHPVESVLLYPTGGMFISAGGTVVKVWDALAGGRLLATFTNHHKTVTSLAFCSNHQRLLSASLDRNVKIYDVGSFKVVHTLVYPSAILSVACSPDDNQLVVGMADGLLSAQRRRKTQQAEGRKEGARRVRSAAQGDHVVDKRKTNKMALYDRHLRHFNHSKALDAGMRNKVRLHHPEVTVSVLQELIRREGIRPALAGRSEQSVVVIVKFLKKHISNPKFTNVLIDISNMLIDLYANQIGHTPNLEAALRSLQEVVDSELSYMVVLMQTLGSIDTILSASRCVAPPTTPVGINNDDDKVANTPAIEGDNSMITS